MAEKNKIPEIRFKGFSGEWEECDLGDVCLIGDIDHRMPQSVINGIPYIMTGGFVGINDLDFDNSKLISTEDYEQLSKKIKPESGDILFARYASVGAVRYVETQIKFLVSYSCAILKHNDTYNGKYLFYYLQSNKAQYQIELEINTGSQRNIGIDSLKKLIIHLPKENEQVEVAKLLSNLDKLITLHQAKYNKLVSIKKAMLEKMFPKRGADVPEIRFKGFSGTWEERGLAEITFSSGVKNSDNVLYESYSISNVNGFVPQDEQFEHGGTMRDADKSMYYIVSPQSFAYNPARINVGSIGYQNLSKSVIVSSLYDVFKTTDECDDGFLWYWIKTEHFQKLIEQYQEGGVRLYFYYDKFCKGTIKVPCVEEQTKIGSYFQKLDNVILLNQRKLEKLKNIKKACLEKMFV